MPTTAKGLRYPAATDPVADGYLAIQHLAEDVDAQLSAHTSADWAATTNGWASAAAPQKARVTKLPSGLVLLTGRLNAGTLSNGDSIGSLPAGYGPSVKSRYPVATSAPANAAIFIDVPDPAAGNWSNVQIFGAPAGISFIDLGGVIFPSAWTP